MPRFFRKTVQRVKEQREIGHVLVSVKILNENDVGKVDGHISLTAVISESGDDLIGNAPVADGNGHGVGGRVVDCANHIQPIIGPRSVDKTVSRHYDFQRFVFRIVALGIVYFDVRRRIGKIGGVLNVTLSR